MGRGREFEVERFDGVGQPFGGTIDVDRDPAGELAEVAGIDLLFDPAKIPAAGRGFLPCKDTIIKTLFVGNLPPDATEAALRELFSAHGTVRSIRLVADLFSGVCKGFGLVEMEGHEARAAIAGLDGKMLGDKHLKVKFEEPRKKGGKGRRR